jgi:hypothetical protein
VKELVRRFAADVVRREPGTQDDWLARLVQATRDGA